MLIRKIKHQLVTFIDSLKHDRKRKKIVVLVVQRKLHAIFKVFSLYCDNVKLSFMLQALIAKYYNFKCIKYC